MPAIDFKVDVDGFAFKNDWTFNAIEKQQIHDIVQELLPAAAAILTPVLAAASPAVVAVAAPVVGLLGPLLPFLPVLAPVIAEKLVDSIADAIVGEANSGNLCSGMAFAAVDYYRLKWVVPRGNSGTDNPKLVVDGGTPASDALRTRIWNAQLDSHQKDTPQFVAWVAMGLFLGDDGLSWLRDRTREELFKLSTKLAAGEAVPLALVMRADKPYKGHVVVATALDWLGANWCRVTIYDNELPDQHVVYEVDARGDSALIKKVDEDRTYRALFCANYAPAQPRPALVLTAPLALNPSGFAGEGLPVSATFTIKNDGFGDKKDHRAAIGTSTPVALQASPAGFDNTGSPILAPLGVGSTFAWQFEATFWDAGLFDLVPLVLLYSSVEAEVAVRRLPMADGTDAAAVSLRVNPVIPINPKSKKRAAPSGCARPLVEGESVTLVPDLSPVAGRGVVSVGWTVSGSLALTATGPALTIPALPPAPGSCQVKVNVSLADGTQAFGQTRVEWTTSATADRIVQLCQIMHVVSHAPFSNIPFGPAIDPQELADWAVRFEKTLEPDRVIADLLKSISAMQRKMLR